jgi:two-component system chemotaxis sensor kinase CheA
MPIELTDLQFMEQAQLEFRAAEAQDLLMELDSALLALEEEPSGLPLVHRVFRAIHTIKGTGAAVGLAHLARFAHGMEEAFDLARAGRLSVTPNLIDFGLKACDVIRLIIEEAPEGPAVLGEAAVTAEFTNMVPASASAPTDSGRSNPTPEVRAAYKIVFKPDSQMFRTGPDPVALLDLLRDLGEMQIAAHVDRVPPLSSLDAERCYLWWEMELLTSCGEPAIQEVFALVEEDCELRIELKEQENCELAQVGFVPPEAFDLFVAECGDHLEGMEREALALEANPASRADLDSLFRAVHSIKGNTGLVLGYVEGSALSPSHPLQQLLRVAHGLESLLEPFRGLAGGPVSAQIVQSALDTCDTIRKLLANLTHPGVPNATGGSLADQGVRPTGAASAASETVDGRDAAFFNTTSQCVELIAGCLARVESGGEFSAPVLETYQRGLQTLSAAAHYRKCSELDEPVAQQLRILAAAMTAGAALSPDERAALGVAFDTSRSVLQRLSPPGPVIKGPELAVAAQPSAKLPVDRPDAEAAHATIRIEQNKLDRLMRVVGELLVARGAFPLLLQRLNDGANRAAVGKDLKEAGSSITRIADELQASVMSIRMLPVKAVFQKFPRLVRDLARSLGKQVRLVMEGEAIELDKTILEQIADPLVHLIRNAVDHGLEHEAERRAAGKDPCGQVTLRARYEAGGVSIEVSDDGPGLNVMALRRKAVEKGLLTLEAVEALSDEAAGRLVFLPGLTTAAQITAVSGRGVGMDVVLSNVRNLQGTVDIRSKPGCGTAVVIKLPTSLMISKGILLEAGAQQYILPLSNIREMVKLPATAAHQYRGLTLAHIRGTPYPLFNLAEVLGLLPLNTPELSVAIVEAGDSRYGLVVDRFLVQVEVLVKPLAGGLEGCKEFQGAAIMGDGRVVLVLNALECHNLNRGAR